MARATTAAVPAQRTAQKRCTRKVGTKACNHPESFHPKKGRCKALGCKCEGWVNR